MQTSIDIRIKDTNSGKEASNILRKCVHCGFCNATCPTYQLLGDELDGPRGRIYLIKQALEGNRVTRKTQTHLDRCLTCRACETTCPSGVDYHRLLDIGRDWVEQRVKRPGYERLIRKLLRSILPYKNRFDLLLKIARITRPLLPANMKQAVSGGTRSGSVNQQTNQYTGPSTDNRQFNRKMLLLDGCVQASLAPNINNAAVRLFASLGIESVKADKAGCCGAISWHLSALQEAQAFMRRNIDAWWPYIENGVEAIVMTASGCGALVTEYGDILANDKKYAEKARRVSELTKDISEILVNEDLSAFKLSVSSGKCRHKRVAYHAPCSLQHGQKITGVVEQILEPLGYELTQIANAHSCCGSAGTYSILQGKLSQQLLAEKIECLEADRPDVIATMNIGCQMHIASQSNKEVLHVVELLVKNSL